MATKMNFDFKEMDFYFDKLKELADDDYVKKIGTECLEEAHKIYTDELVKAWEPHNARFSGNTGRQIIRQAKIITAPNGSYFYTEAGFRLNELTKEGYPSIFVAYGQPAGRMKPDTKLRNAMLGRTTRRKIRNAQKKILENAVKEKMK
jgi:hypothetical protein